MRVKAGMVLAALLLGMLGMSMSIIPVRAQGWWIIMDVSIDISSTTVYVGEIVYITAYSGGYYWLEYAPFESWFCGFSLEIVGETLISVNTEFFADGSDPYPTGPWALEWDTSGFQPGYYWIEVLIVDWPAGFDYPSPRERWDYYLLTVLPIPIPAISATVDVEPDTLNPKDNGQWVTAYIELSEGYNVGDIDVNSILLNSTIPVDMKAPVTVGDFDSDDIPDLMVKFDRATITEWSHPPPDYDGKYYEIDLAITGAGTHRYTFTGIDTIRVLM